MSKFNIPHTWRNHSGQSVVEYFLLIIAVVVVFLVFFRSDGPFKNTVETVVNGPVGLLEWMANNLPLP